MRTFFYSSLICLIILFLLGPQYIFAQSISASQKGGGSDYSVTFSYEMKGGCDCDNTYVVGLYKNNFLPSSFFTSSTKRKSELTANVGPNVTNTYIIDGLNKGKNKLTLFCALNCSHSKGKNIKVTTAKIKPPKNGSGSTNEDFVTLKWSKGTNIPSGRVKYKIAKGTEKNVIATVSGTTYEYTDDNVGPGENYTYYVTTYTSEWGKHESVVLEIQASTAARSLRTTSELPKKVVLSWDDLSHITKEITVRRNGEAIAKLDIDSDADTVFTDDSPSLIPGFQYDYSIGWRKEEVEYRLTEKGSSQANGRIRGRITTPLSQIPIENVAVCAELEDDIEQASAGLTYCDTTDANGQYDIRRIYYHVEGSYKVTAQKENHAFDPAFFEGQILELDFPDINQLNFLDTTSYTLSGTVYQSLNGQDCGFEGAEIWVDDAFKGVKTDENGFYEVLVEESGTYTISARLNGHVMEPEDQTLFIEARTNNIDFRDTTTRFLEGYIKGSCDIVLGRGMVRAYSLGGAACIDTLIPTNENGFYTAILPARKYGVEVVAFEAIESLGLDSDFVLSYFDTEEVDLTDEGQTQDFTFRRPPVIVVNGLPDNDCDNLGYAVVEQNESYFLEIEVVESFGNLVCPVAEGYIVVFDEAGDKANEPDTIELQNGKALYELIPATPNIIAPYQKLFQIEAIVGKEEVLWTNQLVVSGIRPREQTFTTVLPEIPLLILHDPPGDASFSYFEKANKTTLGMRIFGQQEGSLTAKKEVKLGASTKLFGAEFESWGILGGSISAGARASQSQEWILSMESTERFSTSNNQDITGEEGDIYIGAAMNLIYAQADILTVDLDACAVNKDINIVMGNDGFATTFMYTEDHIENTLIPQLSGLRDFYRTTNSDSAAIYDNQIAVWKQVVDKNRANKKDAAFIENRSFSAGATYASSVSGTSESNFSLELTAFVDASIWKNSGFEINGSGVSGEVRSNLRIELGTSVTGSALEQTTTGFELKDDDPGDFFSINIKKDPVYGTPVFDLVSGRSSCPWETGTQPRESLQLISDSYTQSDIPEDEAAVFVLGLGNISQSDETRTYLLKFLQASNPDGALVTIGGSEAQDEIPYTIAPGSQSQATITIRKGPRATDYEGLQFVLLSGCGDGAIADTVALSVGFRKNYPSLELAKPINTWLVNSFDNNELQIRFDGYDRNRLRKVQLLYSPKDQFNWSTAAEWQNGDISDNPGGTVVSWEVTDIIDGQYDLRLKADYGDADVYSSIVGGRIDRQSPRLFGLPVPTDQELNAGELMMLTFDEAISCFGVQASNVQFRSLTRQSNYNVSVGCADRTIIIQPQWTIDEHIGEEIEVRVWGIADQYENVIPEIISWKFVIGQDAGTPAVDTDNDGIIDEDDNCPLAENSDQSDIDNDGIGDVCDEDIDGDGVLNEDDNCPYFANPDQMDMDNNGVGDVCEPEADGDGDGIPNASDICPFVFNPDQSDIDKDGIGDVCDEDMDGDGLPNREDNCPLTPNPSQLDSNGDSNGDACANITSTEELATDLSAVRVYPNPASSNISIDFKIEESNNWRIQIINLNGQILFEQPTGKLTSGNHHFEMNIDQLPRGLYLIRLASKRGMLSKKLMVN